MLWKSGFFNLRNWWAVASYFTSLTFRFLICRAQRLLKPCEKKMQFLKHWSIQAESVLLLLLHWPWSWSNMYLEHRCQEDGDACKDEHHQTRQPLLPVGRRKKWLRLSVLLEDHPERRGEIPSVGHLAKAPCPLWELKGKAKHRSMGAGPHLSGSFFCSLWVFKKCSITFYLFIPCMCMHVRKYVPVLVYMWWSEDDLKDSVLSFTTQVPGSHEVCFSDSRNWTRASYVLGEHYHWIPPPIP